MAGAMTNAAKRRGAAPTERRAARQHLRERPGGAGRRSGAKERVENEREAKERDQGREARAESRERKERENEC